MKHLLLSLLLIGMVAQVHAVSSVITTNASVCPGSTNTTALVIGLPEDKGSAGISISGTWTGTISFYATADGGVTWTARNATPLASTTAATSTTSNGTWQVSTAGLTGLCVLSSATMTGTAVVTITPSTATFCTNLNGGSGNVTVAVNGVTISSQAAGSTTVSANASTISTNLGATASVNGVPV